MNKPTLGKGLRELLSSPQAMTTPTAEEAQDRRFLPIELLQPGKYQPRRNFVPEALQELADSIAAQGVLQPLLVRLIAANQYEIIAGERRWRAAQLAGLHQVPVFIREISDEAAIAMSLIENIQREDLNVIEQAVALKRLGEECDMTHEAIAAAVGKSRVTVSNILRLLQLAPPVKALLEKGALEMGHARALLSLETDKQVEIAHLVVARRLSVRETENAVRKALQAPMQSAPPKTDPDITRLQSALSDKLGAAVKIQHSATGKGKLVIHYHSLDALEGILEVVGA